MAKWLIVDPYTQQVAEVDINEFKDIGAAIGADVYVEPIILSRFPGDHADYICGLWVDEEGFLKSGIPVMETTLYNSPLAGRVVYGTWAEKHVVDEEEEDFGTIFIDASCPQEVLAGMFKFTDLKSSDYTSRTFEDVIGNFTVLRSELVRK